MVSERRYRRGAGVMAGGRTDGIEGALLPFAPMIYVAWADGALSAEEIGRIRAIVEAQRWTGDAGPELDRWLDPSHPPESADLAGLLAMLRSAARDATPDERRSLARLGERLARVGGLDAPGDAVRQAVDAVERALGVPGAEAVRAIADTEDAGEERTSAASRSAASPLPDPAAIEAVLEPRNRELRARVFDVLARPVFDRDPDLTRHAWREKVLEWTRILADEGLTAFAYPPAQGGEGDIGRSIAVFETLAYHEQSLVVKYGVQFGLFGGSILHLGTQRHHERYLADVAALRLPGCYAMTEVGHGSNVREIGTVARYDEAAGELVVDTPTDADRKDWIGNAALHARMATVFAQLEVGGRRVGVQPVLVPIRDDAGAVLPGVEIEDCGEKEGLNGVDNGRIRFTSVRVPRENLLDRFGSITSDGRYESPIPSDGRRFFTMLGTLVAGRISIAAASVSAAKVGLIAAVRYTDGRRQFGPEGGPEVPVLDYLAQQRRLLPRLATTYALHFAVRHLEERYAAVEPGRPPDRDVEVGAAALKAYASEHAVTTLQQCRQACGGRGYLASARFGRLMADTDVFTTFEGANLVLRQLVARGLLTELKEHLGELRTWGVARYVGRRAADAVATRNPIVERRTDSEHLRSPDTQLDLLRWREEHLVTTAGRRLKRRLDDGVDSFLAVNEIQDHLVAVADAYAERVLLERFVGVERATEEGDSTGDAERGAFAALRSLYALSRIEADRGWFLESGGLEARKSKAIRDEVNRLCRELRPAAVALVDAFGVPAAVLRVDLSV